MSLTPQQIRKLESLPWLAELQAPVRTEFLSYAEAQKVVQQAGIKATTQFRAWKRPAGVSSTPQKTYANEGWRNWKEFFGTGTTSFVTYAEAQKVVQAAGIKTKEQFHAWQRPAGVPSNPNIFYKNSGWRNWKEFLGTGTTKFVSYREAQKVVQAAGITTCQQFQAWERSAGVPGNPNKFYKTAGWHNWNDFFGTPACKAAKYWLQVAKKLAAKHGGKLPSQAWCRAHGHSGLLGIVLRHPQLFRTTFVKVRLGMRGHGHWLLKRRARLRAA